MTLNRIHLIVLFVVGVASVVFVQQYLSSKKPLKDRPAISIIGNKDADVLVIEFFDYSCVYCQQAHATFMEAVRRDGKVAYSPRPIMRDNAKSMAMARIMLAATWQNKSKFIHSSFMAGDDLTQESLVEIAKNSGIDLEQLSNDMKNHSDEIQASIDIASKLHDGLDKDSRVPMFWINEKQAYVPEDRMPTPKDFMEMFAIARGEEI